MKIASSPRKVSLMLLAGFGLLLVLATVVAVRFTYDVSLLNQIDRLKSNLETIAQEISEDLDENDEDAFDFLEISSRIQKKDENYSYILRDSSGTILAPEFVAGKQIEMDNIIPVFEDGTAFVARVWKTSCLVVVWPFPDRPLELLGIFDNKYIFNDVHFIKFVFIVFVAVVFAILLLIAFLWIIPALERIYDQRNRAKRELDDARSLQLKAVTCVFPEKPWFDIHAELRAMKDVGGDIFLCGMVGEKLCFVVGDVSDKGIEAAFVMFMLSSFIRSRIQSGIPLWVLMAEVNRLICDNPDYEMFCTLFMGTIDPETLEMEYCNAGHTRALVDGDFLAQDPQLIAGIDRSFVWHTQKVRLHHGSRLLLYTDGVTEARNEERAFFGEERLKEWVNGRPEDTSCAEDCIALLGTIGDFRGKARQNDDIAIMCIRII
ncbi:MAG: serine/threonine-protein phosphatase [Bacteroidales bacterium]|nr:serine/threonine-protein phosphatase [Bacteroidales bacterium]